MSRGVLMYAHNNSEIDYIKIACANALMVQYNLGVPITLVTDEGTLSWGASSLGEKFINTCFENIICVDRNYEFNNPRHFNDTSYTTKSLQFYNCNHWEAYELTPYDETLFIDADYLIMSNSLNNCWGSDNDVMIDHRIHTPGNPSSIPSYKSIDEFGIKLYWATVIYFKKTPLAEAMFSIVKHVQDNYRYYKDLYGFSNGMYRNDYAFSIAVHTLNGYEDSQHNAIGKLPITGLLMSWDTDDIHSIPATNTILLYNEKPGEKGSYTLSKLINTDVHIMNKWAISRIAANLIHLYRKDRHE